MRLTEREIRLVLEALSGGRIGYSDDPEIASLQGKLSIMLQATSEVIKLVDSLKGDMGVTSESQ